MPLFDDIICDGEQRRRHGQAEGFGGAQVDHEFELARLDDRKVAELRAGENPASIETDLRMESSPRGP
jgi:hypothetical protein